MYIFHGGKLIHMQNDKMEPEDASFNRDLSWIKQEILDAYARGLQDGIKGMIK